MSFTKVLASDLEIACNKCKESILKQREECKEENIQRVMNLPRTWYRWFPPNTREKALKYLTDECYWFELPWSQYYVPSSVDDMLELAKNSKDGYVSLTDNHVWIMKWLNK